MRKILKWTVPVDGAPHPIGTGRVVLVGCKHYDPETVFVWTDEPDAGGKFESRPAQVFGTGQPLPDADQTVFLGSTIVGALVWHVFELTEQAAIDSLGKAGS